MFIITVNNKYMRCSNGRMYTYNTFREAYHMKRLCYGNNKKVKIVILL
jgi:hypothetical protein